MKIKNIFFGNLMIYLIRLYLKFIDIEKPNFINISFIITIESNFIIVNTYLFFNDYFH